MILDIRKSDETDIKGIKFDDSEDLIGFDEHSICLLGNGRTHTILCQINDFDNLIKALHKAHELVKDLNDE